MIQWYRVTVWDTVMNYGGGGARTELVRAYTAADAITQVERSLSYVRVDKVEPAIGSTGLQAADQVVQDYGTRQ